MATLEKSGKPKKVGRPKGSTKSKTKTKTKTTSGSKTKGGNFLGAVGELVAPTGWESFVTTAALVGIDRADAALRRGKSGKSSIKKGGRPPILVNSGDNLFFPNEENPGNNKFHNNNIVNQGNENRIKEYWNKTSSMPLDIYKKIKKIYREKAITYPKHANKADDKMREIYWDGIIFPLYEESFENGKFSFEKLKKSKFLRQTKELIKYNFGTNKGFINAQRGNQKIITPIDKYIKLYMKNSKEQYNKNMLLSDDLYVLDGYLSTIEDIPTLESELKKLKKSVDFSKLGQSNLTKLRYIGKYFKDPYEKVTLEHNGMPVITQKIHLNLS